MKWNKCWILFTILLVVVVLVTIHELCEATYIKNCYTTVGVRFKTVGVTEKQVNSTLEHEKSIGTVEIPEITAWLQKNEQEAKNNMLGRKAGISVIIACGDITLTAPMTILHGNYTYPGDLQGCVIDSVTAYQLYGMEDAIGNTLTYKNEIYYVRGVVKTSGSLLLITGAKDTQYTNLELRYSEQERGEDLVASFLMRNRFPQDYLVLDSNFYGKMQNSLRKLPIWIFYLALSLIAFQSMWKKRCKYRLRTLILCCLVGMIGIIGFGILLYQLTGAPVYIPEKLVPTRLSDFDYWSNEFRRIRVQLQELSYINPNNRDIELKQQIAKTVLNAIISLLLYGIFLLGFRKKLISEKD